MTTAVSKGKHDPKAGAVAQYVYDSVHPLAVILFGSRSRGDYREDSDVDLLVIISDDADGRSSFLDASAAAFKKLNELYDLRVGMDVVHLTKSGFTYGRRAKNHVAGQALRDGVIVSQESFDPVGHDEEPTNWPDIEQRFIAATRNIRSLTVLIEGGGPQEDIGFHAQQAVENALKAWISALDDEYRNIHDLGDLAAIIRRRPEENDTPAGESLLWLTTYAVTYRYEGARVAMDDHHGLLARVTELVNAISDRIRALTGDTPPEWKPL
jgi:HEPN domain-containing protein/predicted nucleotidyltransferase